MYLLNVWQEIFEAFSKGSAFMQTFGVTAGIIVFILLILRPILTAINNNRSQKEDTPSIPLTNGTSDNVKKKTVPIVSEYMKFCNWLVEFQYQSRSKSKHVQEFCSIGYKINGKCIVYISNVQLTEEHYKIIITIFSLSKASLGIILCKPSESEENEILKTIKAIKEKFPERSIIDINNIHWFDKESFSPIELIPFMGFGNDWIFKRLKFKDKQGNIYDPFKLQ